MSLSDFGDDHIAWQILALEFKKHNAIKCLATNFTPHHLCANGTRSKRRMVSTTILKILKELGYSKSVFFSFDLYRDYKMNALTIRANVKLIYFDLTDAIDLCAKVVL